MVCGLAPPLQASPPSSPWRQTTWRLLSPGSPLAQEQGVQGEVSQRAGQGCSRQARVSLGRLLPPHLDPFPSSCSWPLVTQATVRCWTPAPQLCEQTATLRHSHSTINPPRPPDQRPVSHSWPHPRPRPPSHGRAAAGLVSASHCAPPHTTSRCCWPAPHCAEHCTRGLQCYR